MSNHLVTVERKNITEGRNLGSDYVGEWQIDEPHSRRAMAYIHHPSLLNMDHFHFLSFVKTYTSKSEVTASITNSTTCTPSSVFSNCSGLLNGCYTESESLMRRAAWVQKKRQWSWWWELEMIRDPAAQVHTQLLWEQEADIRVTRYGHIRGEVGEGGGGEWGSDCWEGGGWLPTDWISIGSIIMKGIISGCWTEPGKWGQVCVGWRVCVFRQISRMWGWLIRGVTM